VQHLHGGGRKDSPFRFRPAQAGREKHQRWSKPLPSPIHQLIYCHADGLVLTRIAFPQQRLYPLQVTLNQAEKG
jgi:hypothetical protein